MTMQVHRLLDVIELPGATSFLADGVRSELAEPGESIRTVCWLLRLQDRRPYRYVEVLGAEDGLPTRGFWMRGEQEWEGAREWVAGDRVGVAVSPDI